MIMSGGQYCRVSAQYNTWCFHGSSTRLHSVGVDFNVASLISALIIILIDGIF